MFSISLIYLHSYVIAIIFNITNYKTLKPHNLKNIMPTVYGCFRTFQNMVHIFSNFDELSLKSLKPMLDLNLNSLNCGLLEKKTTEGTFRKSIDPE